jgi:hypothetical protein
MQTGQPVMYLYVPENDSLELLQNILYSEGHINTNKKLLIPKDVK